MIGFFGLCCLATGGFFAVFALALCTGVFPGVLCTEGRGVGALLKVSLDRLLGAGVPGGSVLRALFVGGFLEAAFGSTCSTPLNADKI